MNLANRSFSHITSPTTHISTDFKQNLSTFVALASNLSPQAKAHNSGLLFSSSDLVKLVDAAEAWGLGSNNKGRDALDERFQSSINECIRRSSLSSSLTPWDARQILNVIAKSGAKKKQASTLLDQTLVQSLWEKVCEQSPASSAVGVKIEGASNTLSPFEALKILTETDAEAETLRY